MSEPLAKKPKLEESSDASISSAEVRKLLNSDYLSSDLVETIRTDYLSHKPFHYTVLPSFMDPDFLKSVGAELEQDQWFPKNNDLYTFLQTDDLKISQKVRSFNCITPLVDAESLAEGLNVLTFVARLFLTFESVYPCDVCMVGAFEKDEASDLQ